jgi:hypothetical protein
MERSEVVTNESKMLTAERETIIADNRAMRHSVGQSSEVIEKLIALNAELMDAANRAAFNLERAR